MKVTKRDGWILAYEWEFTRRELEMAQLHAKETARRIEAAERRLMTLGETITRLSPPLGHH